MTRKKKPEKRMLISFAWTTHALLAGRKTVTRRAWADSHIAKFKAGMEVTAWDRLPRVRGARPIARIRLTEDPYLQSLYELNDKDFIEEGLDYYTEPANQFKWPFSDPPGEWFEKWKASRGSVTVIRFELLEVL